MARSGAHEMKEGQATLPAATCRYTCRLPLLADSRIDDLRNLSQRTSISKLIRLCEELNTAYNNGCYVAALSNGRPVIAVLHV